MSSRLTCIRTQTLRQPAGFVRHHPSKCRQPLRVSAFQDVKAASRVERGVSTCLNCQGEGEVVCRSCKGKGIDPNFGDPRDHKPSLMKRKLQEVKEMLGGDHVEIDWKVTNRCMDCRGTGRCQCSICKGTGKRVATPAGGKPTAAETRSQ